MSRGVKVCFFDLPRLRMFMDVGGLLDGEAGPAPEGDETRAYRNVELVI